ncbi:LysR family transcriptional regulator [Parafrigoribacterium soli]|uniref:LysR family transcriptional regulator n=1 Tax=Parafrigoribacterium soli TaxID=3144663 RepID=UPI0032EB095E
MDGRQLEYFVAVAEELNFTRAAVKLFAAQSTVSAGIRSLEQELGATLFDRSTKIISLTAAGSSLLPEARGAIEALDRVRSSVALNSEGLRGRLRIGTFIALDAVRLPEILGEFHRRHPHVDIQLIASPSGSTGLSEEVRHGRADVAFAGLPLSDLASFNVLEVARSPFVAILPATHPLAAGSEVRLGDLVTERWIDSPAGYASRIVFDRVLAERGLTRVISDEVADAGEMPKLVAAGLGIAAIPEIIYRPAAGVVVRPIVDSDAELVLTVISRAHPAPATAAFLALMSDREQLART